MKREITLATLGLGVLLFLSTGVVAQGDVLHVVGDQVGIGTSDPLQTLHMDATAPGIRWVNESGQTWDFFVNATTGRLNFRDITGGNVVLKMDPGAGQNLFRLGVLASNTVDIDGNLVVNDDLTVYGTITNPPDYVFRSDYQLMPLADLERFVLQNNHLPRVPSAKEIVESGVNVVDLQMRLLEKIEELVLYTLEQERALGTQQEVIERLETRLVQLESDQSSL